MNNKRYQYSIDIINIILRFLASYTVISMLILIVTKDPTFVLKALSLFLAPIISYIIGKSTKHIWSYMALHLFMVVAYYLTSVSLFLGILYVLYLIILTITTFVQKLRVEEIQKENTPLLLIGLFCVMNLCCNYLKIFELNNLFFLLLIVYILLYLLNLYLLNFEKFLQYHSNMSKVPIHQITNTNNTLVLFFGSFCIIVMLLFTKLPIGEILSSIGSLIVRILRSFFSLFAGFSQEEVAQEDLNVGMSDSLSQIKNSEPSAFLELILKIILWLIALAMIVAIIALIVYGIYKLYQHFYMKKTSNFRDNTEFISPFEKRDKLGKEHLRTRVKNFRNVFGQSNNEKIRKHFYKAVTKHIDSTQQLSNNLTPSQLSKYALTKERGLMSETVDSEKMNQLTTFYEKARYSNEECSKEEVQSVKNILKPKD